MKQRFTIGRWSKASRRVVSKEVVEEKEIASQGATEEEAIEEIANEEEEEASEEGRQEEVKEVATEEKTVTEAVQKQDEALSEDRLQTEALEKAESLYAKRIEKERAHVAELDEKLKGVRQNLRQCRDEFSQVKERAQEDGMQRLQKQLKAFKEKRSALESELEALETHKDMIQDPTVHLAKRRQVLETLREELTNRQHRKLEASHRLAKLEEENVQREHSPSKLVLEDATTAVAKGNQYKELSTAPPESIKANTKVTNKMHLELQAALRQACLLEATYTDELIPLIQRVEEERVHFNQKIKALEFEVEEAQKNHRSAPLLYTQKDSSSPELPLNIIAEAAVIQLFRRLGCDRLQEGHALLSKTGNFTDQNADIFLGLIDSQIHDLLHFHALAKRSNAAAEPADKNLSRRDSYSTAGLPPLALSYKSPLSPHYGHGNDRSDILL